MRRTMTGSVVVLLLAGAGCASTGEPTDDGGRRAEDAAGRDAAGKPDGEVGLDGAAPDGGGLDGGGEDGGPEGGRPDGAAPDGGGPEGGGPSGGGVHWNPGHYIRTSGDHSGADQAGYLAGVMRTVARVDDDPEVLGAMVTFAWGALEPTEGTYDFSSVRTVLDDLEARGKRLILEISYKGFRGTAERLAPADLSGEVVATTKPRGGTTYTVAVWKPAVMDRLIALWTAVGAEFADRPGLEMVTSSESTPSLRGTRPPGYSPSVMAAQLRRMYAAMVDAFPRSNVAPMINSLGGVSQVGGEDGLLEACYLLGAGRGAPDLYETPAFALFRGEPAGGVTSVRDYRGTIPHMAIWSGPAATRGNGDTDTPADALRWARAQGVTHLVWITYGSGEDSWSNVLAAIRAAASPDDIGDAPCPTRHAAIRGGCR